MRVHGAAVGAFGASAIFEGDCGIDGRARSRQNRCPGFGMGRMGGTVVCCGVAPFPPASGVLMFLFPAPPPPSGLQSGVHIFIGGHLTRRNRFIAACVLAIGVGVSIVPGWATNNLWPSEGLSSGVEGLRDAIINILSEGYAIGAILGIILDTILPMETPNVVPEPEVDAREDSVAESMPSVTFEPREEFEPDYSKGSYEPGHDAVNFIRHLAHMDERELEGKQGGDLDISVEGGSAYYAAPGEQVVTKDAGDDSIDFKTSGSDNL